MDRRHRRAAAPVFDTLCVLCVAFRELLRDPGVIMVRLAMYAMLSALIGAMYANVGSDKDQESVVARVSVLFYVAAFMVFMSVAVLPFVMLQRDVFVKERMNGHYGVPAYVLARRRRRCPAALWPVGRRRPARGASCRAQRASVYGLDLFVSLLVAEGFMSL